MERCGHTAQYRPVKISFLPPEMTKLILYDIILLYNVINHILYFYIKKKIIKHGFSSCCMRFARIFSFNVPIFTRLFLAIFTILKK